MAQKREEFLKSIVSFEEFLISMNIAQREAERRLDHDVTLILSDYEKRANEHKKQAMLQIFRKLEKDYFDNYYNGSEMVHHVLNMTLRHAEAEIMVDFSNETGQYVESKLNYAEDRFLERLKGLVENTYFKSAELFGLRWEGEIKMPTFEAQRIDGDIIEPGFSETPRLSIADRLPTSILNPLILKELKMRVPIDIEKKCEVLYYYYQDYLRKSSSELKEIMRTMVDEAKNQLQSQLNAAISQREDKC